MNNGMILRQPLMEAVYSGRETMLGDLMSTAMGTSG
jgi:hypothetical protein